MKDFYNYYSSNKRGSDVSSISGIIYLILDQSSTCEHPNIRIGLSPSPILNKNNSSNKHIVQAKLHLSGKKLTGSGYGSTRSITPSHSSKKRLNESKKKLNEIAEGNKYKLIIENEVKTVIRIMICEDDSGIRNIIKRQFTNVSEKKKLAIELEESINGIECLYKIYKDFVTGNNYDAVLIDETMPFMKGSICINILKNMYSDGYLNKIKIISITALDDQESIKYIKSQGCDEFLPKPHSKEVISKFLDSLVA